MRFDDELAAIGRTVRDRRKELGVTQESLAHRISLTTGQLSKIERGLVNPKWLTLKRIAEGLNQTPVQFVNSIEQVCRASER